jgi:phosphomevalonate kinase
MIEYAAPGKAVIWGEYAVLAGAPALVMAVNRYARTRVASAEGAWHITASGFVDDQTLAAADLQSQKGNFVDGAIAVVRAALSALDDPALPAGGSVQTDTTEFYHDDDKLGIGSSAAICTATCAALAEHLGRPFSEAVAQAAHRALQGKVGSGLDVAAACRGGLIRFEQGRSKAVSWPQEMHYAFVWSGHSSVTTDHLARFVRWRETTNTGALTDLCTASAALFEKPDLEGFAHYTDCLKKLDEAANLGIYSPTHQRLDKLAKRAQVVYKPCGAGGGDIGIAVSTGTSPINSFTAQAANESFLTLDLEIADHGVHRIR